MPHRAPPTSMKIPTDLKAAAQLKAHAEGRTLTDVVLTALRAYVGERVVYDHVSGDQP